MHDDPNPVDEAYEALHAAGWSVGDSALHTTSGVLRWLVVCTKGDRRIEGRGATRAEDWRSALYQAESPGVRPNGAGP